MAARGKLAVTFPADQWPPSTMFKLELHSSEAFGKWVCFREWFAEKFYVLPGSVLIISSVIIIVVPLRKVYLGRIGRRLGTYMSTVAYLNSG